MIVCDRNALLMRWANLTEMLVAQALCAPVLCIERGREEPHEFRTIRLSGFQPMFGRLIPPGFVEVIADFAKKCQVCGSGLALPARASR